MDFETNKELEEDGTSKGAYHRTGWGHRPISALVAVMVTISLPCGLSGAKTYGSLGAVVSFCAYGSNKPRA